MTRFTHVTGVILAGGRALRLGGANKGAVSLGAGEVNTPVTRILGVFQERFDSILMIGSPESPHDTEVPAGVTLARDTYPECGPLGGLHAALANATTPLVFVCGCDMPFLSGPLIEHLIGRARADRPLVPLLSGRPEPLHAIYPVSLATAAEEALTGGIRKMTDFFDTIAVDYLEESDYGNLKGAADSFENINTPDDLKRSSEKLDRKR